MSTMVGADVAELRELAGTFDARAGMLRTIESQLDWRIHSAPWQGSDVDRFMGDWNSRHRRAMIGAAASMAEAAQVLRANADQQEQASAAGFVGTVASVPVLRAAEQQRIAACQAVATGDNWIERALGITGAAVTLTGAAIDGIGTWAVIAATEGVNLRSFPIAEQFIQSSSRLLTGLDFAGKWLGPIGVGFDVLDFYQDATNKDGMDVTGMAFSGASAIAGTAAMLALAGVGGTAFVAAAPVLAAGAAVIGVGSLIYHNRQAIGGFLGDVGDGIASAATWTASKTVEIGTAVVDFQVDTAKAVVDGVTQTAGAVADGVSEAVGEVAEQGRNLVEGIFRKPSWAPW